MKGNTERFRWNTPMKICEQVAHCCIFEQPQVIWLIVLWIVELPFTLPLLLTTIAVFSSVSCIPQKIPKIPPTITMKAIVNTIATHIIIGIAAFSLQPLAAEAYWRTSSSSVPAAATAAARLCGVPSVSMLLMPISNLSTAVRSSE